MTPLQRLATLVCLPVITLALGWQFGARLERHSLEQTYQRLDALYSGATGSGRTITDPEKEVNIDLLWGVWRLLLGHYIDPVNMRPQDMIYGAVHGMVGAIGDPYTVFMTPQENKEFREVLSGELQGIGAELAIRDNHAVVVSPLKGSPAERAGLRPKDIIAEVDGQSTDGKPLNEVVQRIRGKKGTQVTLTIVREKTPEPLTVTITREDIHVPSVESAIRTTDKGTVGILTINQFGNDTVLETTKAVREMKNQKLDALVIDLRYNGGGYLDGAVAVTSLFLKAGKVVSVEGRDASPQQHYVTGRALMPDLPIVVLINEGTASASEIVSGALQDHKRATIIGEKSFGKGTVQEVLDLPGGGSLRVTTAHWLTPNGKNLGKESVMPDITVERTPQDIEAENDPQLDAALAWLLEKRDVTKE